jgi:hypothetical protein
MSKKTEIKTDGGAYVGGNVNTGGGKFVGRDDNSREGFSAREAQKLFESLYKTIETKADLSADDKTDIKVEVDELRQELAKGEKANETFIQRRLRNIGRVAPDILEVTLATIANPVAGFGVIAKKIAGKMDAQAKGN